jgi:tRNA-dihydrouridine synthase
MFVKIRLLDKLEDSIELVRQLWDAGAALITVHARYRVNLVGRTGPGARDGPAHLDQLAAIKKALPHVTIIANGNVQCYEDCEANLALTGADGIMSAEGLLDDPALFVRKSNGTSNNSNNNGNGDGGVDDSAGCATDADKKEKKKKRKMATDADNNIGVSVPDKLSLAIEYLDLVDKYPVKMKSIVFHIRRICKEEFTKYQLMEDCVACQSAKEVRDIVMKAIHYRDCGDYQYDKEKEKKLKEALEKRKREEGNRKAFEDRMMRKAKREGKDSSFYLLQGAEVPTLEELQELKAMPKEKAFEIWKTKHSQHCYNFHFEPGGCHRDRTCSFLHADPTYSEAVAFG